MSLRVGVIGVGSMGRHHGRIYSELPDAEFVAIADPAPAAAEVAREWSVRRYERYEEMLERESLDAVSIATPSSLHREVGLTTLESGVHALIEKPLASSAADARDLADAARERDLVLAVGHVERYNSAILALKHVLETKALGRVSSVVSRRVGIMPPRVQDADIVIDLAVHDIDICTWLFHMEPEHVAATAGSAVLSERFDYVDIFLADGDLGCFVQANWITPVKIRTLAVTGDLGYAEVNYVTQDLLVYESLGGDTPKTYRDFLALGTSPASPVTVNRREPLRVEIEHFLERVKTRTSGDIVTPEEAVRTLEIAEASRAAVTNGLASLY